MSNKLFNMVKMSKPGKNQFDLTHDVKLSMNMGDLVPVCVVETLPGDTFNISADSIIKFAPMVAPVMHRMDVTIHYWYVPNRIVNWDWENFITQKKDPFGNPPPGLPTMEVTELNWSPLLDYFGIPKPLPGKTEIINPTALAAYQIIYHEYYRDQNLIDPNIGKEKYMLGAYPLDEAAISNLNTLRKRAWEHDYFTSALPFAQAGAAVELPLGDVSLKEDWATSGSTPQFTGPVGGAPIGNVTGVSNAGDGEIHVGANAFPHAYDPDGSLEVGSTTINDLRRAFRLQEWLEKTARGGRRYTEILRNFFGVTSSDARLQRPEYITGVKSPVIVSEIVNTTGTVDAPQGNMSGHGLAVVNSGNGRFYSEEHGYIIGIMSVMPKTAYTQGLPKHFLKTTDVYEYFWPEFAHIGEQPILNKEIYAYQGAAGNNVFGYTPRYAEYRFENNRVAGDFRDTLEHWHLARKFAAPPALNQTFIECNPDHRIFAVTDPTEEKLYCQVLNRISAVRPLPKFGTPTF